MVEQQAAGIGTDQQRPADTRAGHPHADRRRVAADLAQRGQDHAFGLHPRQLVFALGPDRLVDQQLVRLPGFRRELEPAHALVDARLGGVGQRLGLGDHAAGLVHDAALEVGRLAERRADLEVDAVDGPGHQVAALGVELDRQLLERDRDRLDERFDVAAVGEGDSQRAVALVDLLGQREPDGHGAVGTGRPARRHVDRPPSTDACTVTGLFATGPAAFVTLQLAITSSPGPNDFRDHSSSLLSRAAWYWLTRNFRLFSGNRPSASLTASVYSPPVAVGGIVHSPPPIAVNRLAVRLRKPACRRRESH